MWYKKLWKEWTVHTQRKNVVHVLAKNFISYLPDKHELLADANEDFKWGKPVNGK